MHHSDDPDRQTFAVSCYLDASGTHDAALNTVVAGLLLNKHNFLSFSKIWCEILNWWKLTPPIHMKEFGRPHGRFAYLTDAQRYAIFAELSELINTHKIISVAATLNQDQYRNILKLHKRKEMSPYGLCFMLCAIANHHNAIHNKHERNIAYILDTGDDNVGHVLAAHKVMKEWQESTPLHVGTIAFDDDKDIPALQAADIIAWGVHRRLAGGSFGKGFDFIEKIISKYHLEEPWNNADLEAVAKRLMKYKDQKH